MNPGQSVKDRAALYIIQDAVRRGQLQPGRHDRRRALRAIPASASPSSATRSAFAPSSSSPRRRARRRRTCCGCAGAELVEVPAVPYANPEQLREGLRPPRREAGRDRAERRDLGEPVRQHRQPRRAISDTTGPEIWEQTGRQGRRLHLRGRHGRHARRRRHGAEGEEPDSPDRPRRSDGRRALQLLHDRRAQIVRAPPSPRASARAASPRTSKTRRSTSPSRSPTRKRCRSSSTC